MCTNCDRKGRECKYTFKLLWPETRSRGTHPKPRNSAIVNNDTEDSFSRQASLCTTPDNSSGPILGSAKLSEINLPTDFIHSAGAIPVQSPQFPSNAIKLELEPPKSRDEMVVPIQAILAGSYFTITPLTNSTPRLLEIPEYIRQFNHFIEKTSGALVFNDDADNPFRMFLVPMALRPGAEHLLAGLLALSGLHHAETLGTHLAESVHKLLYIAINGLRKALHDPDMICDDATLATALILSACGSFSSGNPRNWRLHLEGAKHIIVYRSNNTRRFAATPEIVFLMKLYLRMEVMAPMQARLPCYNRAVQFAVNTFSQLNSPEIDKTIGCRADLLPLILYIGTLTKQPFRTNAWTLAVHQVHFRLQKMIRTLPSTVGNTHTELLACNRAFIFTARLLLLRNFHPTHSKQVQDTVREVLDAIASIPAWSRSNEGLLYPLIHAAVNANYTGSQCFILGRLRAMNHRNKAKMVEHILWTMWNDQGPGVATGDMDREFMLC